MRTLFLGLMISLVSASALAQSMAHDSTVVKDTLTYQEFDQLRLATGGELILRTVSGKCLRVVAKPPKPVAAGQVPDPNIDPSPMYPCAPNGTPLTAP